MKNFKNALIDYRYLKNNGYSDKSGLKLIGDRYKLKRKQRNSLFRGVVSEETASFRKAKIVEPDLIKKGDAAIDWYNVLISVESYLKGMSVFISDDGILRDVSGIHSGYRKSKITDQAINLIINSILYFDPDKLSIYLDTPVAFSGEMAATLRDKLKNIKNLTVSTVYSADYMLKEFEGIVCSSDSVIMDKAKLVFDLPRYIIEKNFKVKIPGLDSLRI